VTIQFPDVSHYQSGLSLKGAPAVVVKATQGSTYRDPAYAAFKAQAAALGIPFAAYHWPDTSDLAAQAHNAFAVIGPGTAVMWDAEAAGATVPRLLELTSRYRALGGVAKLCYLPHWWWQQIGSPDLRPLAGAGLKLVTSNYPATGYSDSGPGWTPYGGLQSADIAAWQYTDKQAFNGQRVDFNAYRGTAAQLAQLLGAGSATTQEDDMATSAEWLGSLINQANWKLDALLPIVTKLAADSASVSPEELAAFTAAAEKAAAGQADAVAAAVLAKLPADQLGLTLTRADVEQAVRDAFAAGLAPQK
jgi:hypothetical protein